MKVNLAKNERARVHALELIVLKRVTTMLKEIRSLKKKVGFVKGKFLKKEVEVVYLFFYCEHLKAQEVLGF